MNKLFRIEALEHKQAERFGRTIIISPLSFKLFTGLASLVVVCIGCFFYWGTYTKKRTVKGYIRPSKGIVTIYAPQRGTIVAQYARLGESIKQGQKLYQIALRHSTQKTLNVNTALIDYFHTQLSALENQTRLSKKLEQTQLEKLNSSVDSLQSQVRQLNRQLKTERAILDLAGKNLERYRTLAAGKMVAQVDFQKIKRDMLTARATVEQVEQKRLELEAQLAQIPSQKATARTDMANEIARIRAKKAQLEQQLLQLQASRKFVVRAPVDGTISSVMAEVGKTVTANMPLMGLLPVGSKFQARLLVPTGSIGFVHAGELVLLRYKAFPYQQFGLYKGQIELVSHSIVKPGEMTLPVSLKEPYYLVTVALNQPYITAYGRRMSLTAGMTLTADIILNRDRLYRWILRPIESLRGPF